MSQESIVLNNKHATIIVFWWHINISILSPFSIKFQCWIIILITPKAYLIIESNYTSSISIALIIWIIYNQLIVHHIIKNICKMCLVWIDCRIIKFLINYIIFQYSPTLINCRKLIVMENGKISWYYNNDSNKYYKLDVLVLRSYNPKDEMIKT